MGHEVTIGGDRLGAGNRMKAYMHGYERSSHDISRIIRTTMAAGTLVPFMKILGLPGDTFDIDLDCDVLTHPTIGPLFGSYKIQLDIFQVPVRLYQGQLHMNKMNIGMDMSKVPLPQLDIKANLPVATQPLDNQQINPSCILSYLGIRGVAGQTSDATGDAPVRRKFNAIPFLAYWDIYKQYYANKQEEIGVVIHRPASITPLVFTAAETQEAGVTGDALTIDPMLPYTTVDVILNPETSVLITATGLDENPSPTSQIEFLIEIATDEFEWFDGTDLFATWTIDETLGTWRGTQGDGNLWKIAGIRALQATVGAETPPKLETFPLTNIDLMREALLAHQLTTPYLITKATNAPYGLVLDSTADTADGTYSKQFSQEGLGIKTYNSDLFNNWISTEWIDGVDGISAITAVSTVGDSFTIDELNLSKKIYEMLNRIAISDGTYDAWLDAVYTTKRTRSAENPMYIGGLIQNLVFQEVVSNAAAEDQPLGTLAGRGRLGNKRKGGHVIAKTDEPSYIIGIISLTPIIDYSQGNEWDTNLKTMNDFHKPALDEIGYQDLITDQMAYWDTIVDANGVATFKSAGKQPAWINYMTDLNKVFGNFADQNNQMFMVLNRRYEQEFVEGVEPAPNYWTIKDLTTYIDPSKFNHIFADVSLDAQNFWVQIGANVTARRKMSAKVIPNL